MNLNFRLGALLLAASLASAAPAPLRGPLPQVLDALVQRGATGATVASLDLAWGQDGCEAVLQPAPAGPGLPLAAATTLLVEVLDRLPADLWLDRVRLEPHRMNLSGRSASFEAINGYRSDLLRLEGAWARPLPYPQASKQGGELRFSLDADLADLGRTPARLDPRRLDRVKAAAGRLHAGPRPLAPVPVAGVAFKGRVLAGGKVLAVCVLPDGGIRMLPVGYRFADAEIVAVEPTGVTLKECLPGTRVWVVPFGAGR